MNSVKNCSTQQINSRCLSSLQTEDILRIGLFQKKKFLFQVYIKFIVHHFSQILVFVRSPVTKIKIARSSKKRTSGIAVIWNGAVELQKILNLVLLSIRGWVLAKNAKKNCDHISAKSKSYMFIFVARNNNCKHKLDPNIFIGNLFSGKFCQQFWRMCGNYNNSIEQVNQSVRSRDTINFEILKK